MTNKPALLAFAMFFVLAASAGAAEETVVIDIGGMTCDLCAVAIKRSLSEINGAKDVRVSFKENRAWLRMNNDVTDETITEAVHKAGAYKVQRISRSAVVN